MNSRRGIVVVACTVFLGSAFFGRAWAQPAGGKLPHPCDILTNEDAEYVFGRKTRLFRSGRSCIIQPDDNRFLTEGVIQALISYGGTNLTWEAMRTSRSGGPGVPGNSPFRSRQVSGLGDEAYMTSLPWRSLRIRKGSAEISVTGVYTDFSDREQLLRYIGEKLVARM
jgi:hypothetical protein